MSPPGKYTIIYEQDNVRSKLFKVLYGKDGSYYVTSPYHPLATAVLIKTRINYARDEMVVTEEELVDVASVDDDGRRLKLAHHPDGFVQFSGEGILSGREPDGTIRGMGVVSWPLDYPIRGPAFSVVIRGPEHFIQTSQADDEAIVYRRSDLTLVPGAHFLIFEGYYFPSLWRRFIKVNPDGTRSIAMVHPARAVLNLRVLLPFDACQRGAFIGLECYSMPEESPDYPSPSYSISSPAGERRTNLEGEITAENLHCMYPRRESVLVRRSANYVMNEIPSGGLDPMRQAPPGRPRT